MLRRPPGSTRTTHSFPTRRSSDLANLHAQAAIDAIAHTRFFMVNTARTPAPRLAAYIVISNDEGIVVDHHALEARIRTHIFADGFPHETRIAPGCKGIENHPEPLPGSQGQRQQPHAQLAYRRKVADEGQPRPPENGR